MIYVLGHNPGQFLSIVLLMLQLAASGGSYPTELEPAFFNFLHPFLPMSYAVSGFRNIISIGDQLTIAKDAGIIAAYGAASLLALYLLKYRRFLDELGEYE
jgi:putative membrane protein